MEAAAAYMKHEVKRREEKIRGRGTVSTMNGKV
jgi:hypothetical protein